MAGENGPERGTDVITDEEVIYQVNNLVDSWDFQGREPAQNAHFTVNLSRWLLETYGVQARSGKWALLTDHEGISGTKLPDKLKHLVMFESDSGDPIYHSHNLLDVHSQDSFVEPEIIIPKWEVVSRQPTFQSQVEMVRRDPEIRDNIVSPAVQATSGVSINWLTHHHLGWGMEFRVDHYGIQAMPFGNAGKTKTPTEFVVENDHKQHVLYESAARLAILGVQYADWRVNPPEERTGTHPKEVMQHLNDRLAGREEIPINGADFTPSEEFRLKTAIINALIAEPESTDNQ
jgi:hypothetical protein